MLRGKGATKSNGEQYTASRVENEYGVLNKCKKPKQTKAVKLAKDNEESAGEATGEVSSNVEIVTETICDEYGNLLAGEVSYAPTITPIDDNGEEIITDNGTSGSIGTSDSAVNEAIDSTVTEANSTNSNDNGNNSGEETVDGDVIDNESTADTDNDGLTNEQESMLGTDPNIFDSDSDGLSDGQEMFLGTDPLKFDSDGDGYSDNMEVMSGSDPLDASDPVNADVLDVKDTADSDGDGLANEVEIEIGTNVDNPDSDGDGLTDGLELDIGTDPLNVDTDQDSLTDYQEVMFHGTNPLKEDSDGDNLSDAFEIENGLDPLTTSNTAMGDALAVSPGCEALMNEEVYTTSIPARVNFVYEIALDSNFDVDEVNEDMEKNMARLVGQELIKCDSSLRRQLEGVSYHQQHNGHRHLLVDGIDSTPPDIVTQKTCTYYTADNPTTPSNSDCYVIQGLMTLYLRENTALSSTSQSSSKALKALLTAMNKDDPSPFLEDSGDDEFSVSGVKGVRYIRGTPDEGGMMLIDNSGNQGVGNVDGSSGGGGGIDGAKDATEDGNDDSSIDVLSPVGITLIAVGALGIIAVAFVAARNVRKRKLPEISPYAEFYDDENDLDMKHRIDGGVGGGDAMTDVDAASLNGTPLSKKHSRTEFYGDDDSIFLGLNTPGGETSENDPTFVHTREAGDGSIAMTAEHGYEFSYNRNSPAPPPPFDEDGISTYQQELPTYTPHVKLESPRYENPAEMIRRSPDRNGRGYYVGDTVEF